MRNTFIILFLIISVGCSAQIPNSWIAKTNFGGASRYFAVGFNIGTKGYIGLGKDNIIFYNDFWEYDPNSDTWSQKANFGGTARELSIGFSIGNKGYVGLGRDGTNSYKKDFWEWDQVSNTWTQKTDFGGTSRSGATGFSIGNFGYVGTGWDGTSYKNDFWEFNSVNNTWSQKADFSGSERAEATSFVIGSNGYVGTGHNVTNKNDFWEYKPTSNLWIQKANFGGTARNGSVGFTIGTIGFIGTGYDGNYRNDFWEYKPASNLWTQKTDFGGVGRYGGIGFSIGSKGYIGIGWDGNSEKNDFWEYTPELSVNLSSGLVSYWSFDGNSNDVISNYNGTNTNVAFSSINSVLNQASQFSGQQNKITVPDNPALSPSDLSVSIWVKPNILPALDDVIGLIDKRENAIGTAGWCLELFNHAGVQNILLIGNNSGGSTIYCPYTLPTNKFTHILVTKSGSGNTKYYVNGNLIFVDNGNWFINNYPTPLLFGNRTNSTVPFSGWIDEVRLWNRELTASEVQSVYSLAPPFINNLIAYYPFTGNATDGSGNGNNGIVHGATLTHDRFGNPNKSYHFNGSTDYIQLPMSQNNISKISIAAWFKTTSGGTILQGRGSGSIASEGIGISLSIPKPLDVSDAYHIQFTADAGGYSVGSISNSVFNDNNWHQVVGVWNGTPNSIINYNDFHIYVDGVLIPQSPANSVGSVGSGIPNQYAPISCSTNMKIGTHDGWNDAFFNGELDNVIIYNCALSDAQIASLYSPAPKTATGLNSGLISYWKLDGNSNDEVGLNHGTNTSAPFSNLNGKINLGSDFNGSTSHIDLGNSPTLKPTAVSVSHWIKFTSTDLHRTPFVKKSSAIGGHLAYGFTVNYGAVGILNFRIETSSGVFSDVTTNVTGLNDGNWHYLVGTYSAGVQIIYIDGVQQAIGGSGTSIHYDSNEGAFIGCSTNNNYEGFFNGSVDEVGVWSRALSAFEISELYNNGNGLQYPFVHAPTLNYCTNPSYPSGRCAEPINVATGSYEYSHEDFKLNTLNGTHAFTRFYDSKHSELTSLGYGWSHSYNFFIINYNDSLYQVHYGDGHTAEFLPTNINGELKSIYGGSYEVLSKDTIFGTYTLRFKNQDVFFFDSTGRLLNITDKNGNSTLLNYTSNNLTQIAFPGGRSWTLNYNGSLISSIVDPLGHSTSYAYDGSNNLTTVTDAKGGNTFFAYNSDHQITQITLPKGNILVTNVYDPALNIMQQTDAYNAVTSIQYNTPVPNAAIVTLPGNATKIFYHDNSYRLIQETNELGKNSYYHYDSDNNRDTITDEKGIITTAEYDNHGNLTLLKKSNESNSSFVYDSKNNLFSTTDPLLRTTNYDRDINGNIISVSLPDNSNKTMTVNSTGQVIESRDGLNHLTTYDYNSFGDLITEVRPNGTYTYTYDVAGRLLTSTDPLNNTTTYSYDNNNNQTSITDPLNQQITFLYDANDNLIRKTDKKQLQTNHTYDLKDRMANTTDADGHNKSLTYDERDNLISETDENGHTTTYGYDSKNRKITTTNSLNAIINFTYDDNDNLLSSTDPNGVTITNEYDSLNRKNSTSNSLNQSTSYSYDPAGNLIQETDPLGRSTSYAYDSLNRLKQVTDAAGGIAVYTYDANGNMTSIRDPNGHIQTISYDNSNRPITTTDADGKTITNTYDAVGNITNISMPNGTVKTIGYDALYRPISIGFSTGQNYAFTYDPNNNVLSASCPTGTETFLYDNLNRKTQFTDVFGNIVSYTYDFAGNRTGVSYPGNNQVAYQYNAINEITKVTDWLNKQTTYNYDATGRLLNMIYPNSIKCDYNYDLRNRLIQLSHYKTATSDTIYHSTMTLDGNSNRTEQTISGLPLLSLTPSGSNYTYTNADKLNGDGATQYTNDDNGNRTSQTTSGNTTSYGFTTENLLQSITTGVNTTSFEYDAFRNRIKKTVNGNPTKFVLDLSGGLSQVLQEQNSAGIIKANYIYGLGLIARIDSAGNIIYYHFDADGNTTLLTNDTSSVTDTYSYEPFGGIINRFGNTDQPYCFLGKYGVQAELGDLYFIRARYYDANVGRFIGKDSYPIADVNPLSINRFVYGYDNPITYRDYTGLLSYSDFGINTYSPLLAHSNPNYAPKMDFRQERTNEIVEEVLGALPVFDLAAFLKTNYDFLKTPNKYTYNDFLFSWLGKLPVVGDWMELFHPLIESDNAELHFIKNNSCNK